MSGSTHYDMHVMLYIKKKSNDEIKWHNITYMSVSTHDDMYVMLKKKKKVKWQNKMT
jgi:hypothetical protein